MRRGFGAFVLIVVALFFLLTAWQSGTAPAHFAERALGLQKRTSTNGSERRRTNCSYPLRFQQKTAFKQVSVSG